MPFWKKVLKIGRRHSRNSKNISRAIITEQHYEILIPRCSDVAELFDNKEKEARELNRMCFMAILDYIQCLACQGMPLRGHGGDEDSSFFQLLMMKSKEFPGLLAWLEEIKASL